jgi:hypothetical protein
LNYYAALFAGAMIQKNKRQQRQMESLIAGRFGAVNATVELAQKTA